MFLRHVSFSLACLSVMCVAKRGLRVTTLFCLITSPPVPRQPLQYLSHPNIPDSTRSFRLLCDNKHYGELSSLCALFNFVLLVLQESSLPSVSPVSSPFLFSDTSSAPGLWIPSFHLTLLSVTIRLFKLVLVFCCVCTLDLLNVHLNKTYSIRLYMQVTYVIKTHCCLTVIFQVEKQLVL